MTLPSEFISQTRDLLGDAYDAFETALDTQSPVSIRIHPHKSVDRPSHFDALERVPWCATGRYLPERPAFTFDPLFHAGTYYVQEASSMFLEQAIRTIREVSGFTREPFLALDLCAAPGGKSTHLLSLLPENGLLVCNEVIRSRSLILVENIAKWGMPNNLVIQNDPATLGSYTSAFDLIVADLPCSGEGMFRKDVTARDEWSRDNVRLCAARQKRIVHDIWNALKPGGWFIYSTCTFNTEENEANVHLLAKELGAELIPIIVKPEWNVANALHHEGPVYRFFPHRVRGEGFFLALLRKNGNQTAGDPLSKIKDRRNKQQPALPAFVQHVLNPSGEYSFHTSEKNILYALPEIHTRGYTFLSSGLNVLSVGTPIGEFKGKDFIPATALAMSTQLNKAAFPFVDLSYEQAIRFLQKEALQLPADTHRGYLLVTFQNQPLGFVKNIGSRANNLYPSEWRIRNRKF